MLSPNANLPKYVRFKNNRYYFEPKGDLKDLIDGKSSIPLGSNLNEMRQRYAEILGLDPLVTRYQYLTMTELAYWYLDEVRKSCTKEHSLRQVHKAKLVSKYFGDSLVRDIRRVHILHYKTHRLENSERVFNNDFSFLYNAFELAILYEVIEHNPCRGVDRLKRRKRVVKVQDDELLAMFNYMLERVPLVCMYMYVKFLCGRRVGELINLTEDCVTEKGVIFTLSKKKEEQPSRVLVCWTSKFREAFENMLLLLQREGHYKPSNSDSPRVRRNVKIFGGLSEGAMGKRFERIRKKAIKEGIITTSFHGHDLRSIGARKLTLECAKDFLQHSNIETTKFFYHEEENHLPEIMPLV